MGENESENDETVLLKNLDRFEEVIIEGIVEIRKKSIRPSFNTVLSHVNNGEEFNLNMKSLRWHTRGG